MHPLGTAALLNHRAALERAPPRRVRARFPPLHPEHRDAPASQAKPALNFLSAMALFHPASTEDLYNLKAFERSGDDIAHRLGDNQDIVANWWLVGVEPDGDKQRAVLIDRSSLTVAFIVGDGVRFGRVVAPSADEVASVVLRFGLHWE